MRTPADVSIVLSWERLSRGDADIVKMIDWSVAVA
jgi:hypothetical protein